MPTGAMVPRKGSRSELAHKHHGLADGLVGDYLLNRWVVEIDFSAQVLRLHDPDRYAYRGRGRLYYYSFHAWPEFLLPTRLRFGAGDEIPITLLVDTGFGSDVVINDSALRIEKGIDSPHRVWYAQSDGSCLLTRATMQVGGAEIPSALVSLCRDPLGGRSPALVGLGILSRFRIIIDEPRKRVILEPTDRVGQRTEANMLGVRWERTEIGDSPRVGTLEPSSAADRAGLQRGDLILAINGHLAAELAGWQLVDLARGGWGKELEFRVRRTTGESTVKVTLVPPL